MKSRIKLLATISLLVPLVFAGTVFAEQGQDDNPVSTTATTDSTSSQSENTTSTETETEKLSDSQKKELAARIEQRKAEAKIKLTTAQQKRLQIRCKSAQGLTRSISGRIKGIETSRGKVHTNLVDRLKKLEAKLKAKGVDTTQLNAEITELEAKIATFNTDLAAYKQAVSDLSNIEDCTADPTAFKTQLEVTRSALQKVRDDSQAIRSYVKDTIKPTLKAIRAQLEAQTTSDDSNNQNNQTSETNNGTN